MRRTGGGCAASLTLLRLALTMAVLVVGVVASKAAPAPSPATKRALLVSVANYGAPYASRKELSAWPSLRSDLDIANMRDVLVSRYGFRDEDILMLQDLKATRGGQPVPGAATREGILAAFRSWLVEPARPGDALIFLYSGHGQQVRDQDGDEPDGLDEALVPYDYVSARSADNAPHLIRDDDLGRLLRELSKQMREGGQVRGSVTCVVDCCHAGTVTRGSVVVKGRGWDTGLDGPAPAAQPATETGLLPPALGWVAFSACQSHESAFEETDAAGKPLGGALTHQLCAALREAGPETTYRDLLERVRAGVKAVRPLQTPGAEGELDRLLFSGLARPTAAYPTVVGVQGRTAELSQGSLHGVTEGSRYALYRPLSDVTVPGNRIGEVTVRSVEAYRCRSELSGTATPTASELRGAKAVLVAQSHPAHRLRLRIEGLEAIRAVLSRRALPEIEDPLELLPASDEKSAYDVRLTRELRDGAPRLVLRRDDGTIVADLPEGAGAVEQLREWLARLWRWRFLSLLRASGPSSLEAAIRIVPVQVERQGDAVRVIADRPMPAGGTPLTLRKGDYLRLEVTNRSPAAVYATVLNLESDGSIAPVFPYPGAGEVEENRIRGGGTLRLPGVFAVEEPFGTDLFKVIVTREKVDFSPLLYPSKMLTRGARDAQAERAIAELQPRLGPLARLLQGAAGSRAVTRAVDPEVWGTAAVTLETRAR